jgi:hypothetical protein
VKAVEVRLRLQGQGEGRYVASRLKIDGAVEAYKPQGGNTVFFGGRSGGPFEIHEAPAEVSFFVPPGDVKITAFSGAQRLFRGRSHTGQPLTIGDLELKAEVGKVLAGKLDIEPSPEIEEDQPKEKTAEPVQAAPAKAPRK